MAPLLAGAAKANITPYVGAWMAGFAASTMTCMPGPSCSRRARRRLGWSAAISSA